MFCLTIFCLLLVSTSVASQDQWTDLPALMSNLARLHSSELTLIVENTTSYGQSPTSIIHNVFENHLVPIYFQDVSGTESFSKPQCKDDPPKESEVKDDNRRPKVFFIMIQNIKSLNLVVSNLLSTVINCPGKQDGGYLRNENMFAFFDILQEEVYNHVFHAYETKRHPHIALFNKLPTDNGFLMSRYDIHTNAIVNLSVWRKGILEYNSMNSLFPWMDMKGYRFQVSSIPWSYLVYADTVESPSDPTRAFTNYGGYYVSDSHFQ